MQACALWQAPQLVGRGRLCLLAGPSLLACWFGEEGFACWQAPRRQPAAGWERKALLLAVPLPPPAAGWERKALLVGRPLAARGSWWGEEGSACWQAPRCQLQLVGRGRLCLLAGLAASPQMVGRGRLCLLAARPQLVGRGRLCLLARPSPPALAD